MRTRYLTLSQAYKNLLDKGFVNHFEIISNGCVEADNGNIYDVEDLIIMESHKFHGLNNPIELTVVYAVRTKDGDQGIIIDAYGVGANGLTSGLIDKVDELSKAS